MKLKFFSLINIFIFCFQVNAALPVLPENKLAAQPFALKTQPADSFVYSPDEMKILDELHGEYAACTHEIMGTKFDEDNNWKSFLLEPYIRTFLTRIIGLTAMIGFSYFNDWSGFETSWGKLNTKYDDWDKSDLALYEKKHTLTGLEAALSNAWWNKLGGSSGNRRYHQGQIDYYQQKIETFKKTDEYGQIAPLQEECDTIKRELWEQTSDCWTKFPLGRVIGFYTIFGLVLDFALELIAAKHHQSIDSMQKLEESVTRILFDENKLEKDDFRVALKQANGPDLGLLDKKLTPEFREAMLKSLERDYALIRDKISKENATLQSPLRFKFITESLFLTLACVSFKPSVSTAKYSFMAGLVLMFILYNFVLPSKDSARKMNVLDRIYQMINFAKNKHFEWVKENAKIKGPEVKEQKQSEKVAVAQPVFGQPTSVTTDTQNIAQDDKSKIDANSTTKVDAKQTAQVEQTPQEKAKQIVERQNKAKKILKIIGMGYVSIIVLFVAATIIPNIIH